MKKLNALIAISVLAVSLVGFNAAVYADDDYGRHHQQRQQYENTISREKAKQIAFKHAGVRSSQVRMEKLKLDRDDGRLKYELEFHAGRTEYKYDIDARNGRILKYDRDHDDYDDRDDHYDDRDDHYDDDRYDRGDDDDDRFDD